jgi:hypothetical protein
LPSAALSAIPGGMGRVSTSGFRLAVALAGMAVLAGCKGGATTPDEAFGRLSQAVTARDGGRLFEALDLQTRWSWMTIQRAQRESYDIILSNFPEGSERERLLRRCQDGALSASARDLFARQLEPATWTALAQQLPAGGSPREVSPGQAELAGNGGPLLFRRPTDRRGGWGFAGFADEAETTKRRALADLELVRTSAADYERAATRQAR